MPQPAPSQPVSARQGAVLVAWARQVIAGELGQPVEAQYAQKISESLADPLFDEPRATFVTLKKAGRLRGCIGSLKATSPLKEDVRRNAANAAFQDPRFPPLRPAELNGIDIEVSILSAPRPLAYADGEDLIRKLSPREDGVIIRQGRAGATFLPQVWEQLPRAEEFLAHLCRKAGLAAEAWQSGELIVETYRVQYFEEGSPS